MTIKDVEARTGMTRANIRFYESEGLVTPVREKNGYRDYSEYDVEVLLRVKLLRLLDIPLSQIKALQNGEQPLTAALDEHIRHLEAEQHWVERAGTVCREMRRDEVRFETLDARPYLHVLEGKEGSQTALEGDMVPKVRSPWRRYFARSFDLSLYSLIWTAVLILVFNVNMLNRSTLGELLDGAVAVVLMVLIEPLLLKLFGTTPGKVIFGQRVTNEEGARLTYGQGVMRTVRIVWYGYGFCIPIYQIYRLWKSYRGCSEGETLQWELETVLHQKDERTWRCFGMLGAHVAVFAMTMLVLMTPCRMPNRGDLTIAEFCENYNAAAVYYGLDAGLGQQGSWLEQENTVILDFGGQEQPQFEFVEENGVLTGLSLSGGAEGEQTIIRGYQDEMLLSAMAFSGQRLSRSELEELVTLLENPFTSISADCLDLEVTLDVSYSGYDMFSSGDSWLLWPKDGASEYSFSAVFSLTRK